MERVSHTYQLDAAAVEICQETTMHTPVRLLGTKYLYLFIGVSMLTAPNSAPATLSVPILRAKGLPAKWVSFRIPPPPRSSAPLSSLFSCTQRYHQHSPQRNVARKSSCQTTRNLRAAALVNLWFAFVGMHRLPEEGTYVIFCLASVAPPPVSTLEGVHRLAIVQAINSPAWCSTAASPQISLCSKVTSRNCFTSHIITRAAAAAAAAAAAVYRMFFCVTSGEGIFYFSETIPLGGGNQVPGRGLFCFSQIPREETPPGREGKYNSPTKTHAPTHRD